MPPISNEFDELKAVLTNTDEGKEVFQEVLQAFYEEVDLTKSADVETVEDFFEDTDKYLRAAQYTDIKAGDITQFGGGADLDLVIILPFLLKILIALGAALKDHLLEEGAISLVDWLKTRLATKPRLKVVYYDGESSLRVAVIDLSSNDVVVNIGGREDNEIVIRNQKVKKVHAQIVHKKYRVFSLDNLGNKASMTLNGKRVKGITALDNCDVIAIGEPKNGEWARIQLQISGADCNTSEMTLEDAQKAVSRECRKMDLSRKACKELSKRVATVLSIGEQL